MLYWLFHGAIDQKLSHKEASLIFDVRFVGSKHIELQFTLLIKNMVIN